MGSRDTPCLSWRSDRVRYRLQLYRGCPLESLCRPRFRFFVWVRWRVGMFVRFVCAIVCPYAFVFPFVPSRLPTISLGEDALRQLGHAPSAREVPLSTMRTQRRYRHCALARLRGGDATSIDEELYSRQLYVMGHAAQRSLAASAVLLIGLSGARSFFAFKLATQPEFIPRSFRREQVLARRSQRISCWLVSLRSTFTMTPSRVSLTSPRASCSRSRTLAT